MKRKRDSIFCKGYDSICSETNPDEFEDSLRRGHNNGGKFIYCNTCVGIFVVKDKRGTRKNNKKNVLMDKYRYHNTEYHDGDLMCTKCGETKYCRKFNINIKTKSGFEAQCKSCRTCKNKAEKLTIVGKIKFLLSSAKQHNNARNKIRIRINNRNKHKPDYVELLPLEFNIDFDYVFNLYEEQCKLCDVSGLDLEKYLYHPLFKMSLERIDDNVGYVKENVVLVCLCFNAGHRRSWTSHDGHTIVYDSIIEKTVGENPNDVEMLKVRKCPNSKCSEFNKKQDRRNCKCGYRIKSMYERLKRNIANHNKDDIKNPKLKAIISKKSYRPFTIEECLQMMKKFEYRCATAGINLSSEFRNNWTPSIDRIDNTKPHTMSNIRIVGCCMNSINGSWTEDAFRIAFKGKKTWTSELLQTDDPFSVENWCQMILTL
jgi:hypothetical protein